MGGNDAVSRYYQGGVWVDLLDDFHLDYHQKGDAMKPPDNPTLAPCPFCKGPMPPDRFTPEEREALSLASQGLTAYCWKYGEWYINAAAEVIRRMLEGGRNAGGTGEDVVSTGPGPSTHGRVPDEAASHVASDPVVADSLEKLIADLLKPVQIKDDGLRLAIEADNRKIAARVEARMANDDRDYRALKAERDRLRALAALYENVGYEDDRSHEDGYLYGWYCKWEKCGVKKGSPHLDGCPVGLYEAACDRR
jgi:hypothetical protein